MPGLWGRVGDYIFDDLLAGPVASLKERVANGFFGDIVDARVQAAAVTIRIDDSRGWDSLTPGPADRPWSERLDDLDDALEAWRKSFMARRLVTLTRSYVVGGGITVSSEVPAVEEFLRVFWDHPKNRMARRLGPMCDELTRAGEIFPVLFTNRVDGMSYVRFVPASRIPEIDTAKNDYEIERRYGERQELTAELKWWYGPAHYRAFRLTKAGNLMPLMLHYAVNKPIGATRGEGDLVPVLPWAKRYGEWLKDRVRLNRRRTRQGIMDVEIADDTNVKAKRNQLQTSNPLEAGIYVHGPGEKVEFHSLDIKAADVKDDGRALRLAIAAGGNVGLHYLGEGEAVNYSTAKEMGEPTARFYTERQDDLRFFVVDIVETAFKRAVALGQAVEPAGGDLGIKTSVAEVARADNQSLAAAARDIVAALREMAEVGWIDRRTALQMALKFAGEPLGEKEIDRILNEASMQIAPVEKTEEQ